MKQLFSTLFLLCCLFACCQGLTAQTAASKKLSNDTIVWSQDSLLHPEDFKAKPKKDAAMGLSSIGIRLYTGEIKGELVFFVKAMFMKKESYLVKNSEYILRHEQTHFDISEIYARLMRKKISQLDFKKAKSVNSEINKIYQSTMKEYFAEQDKYDKDAEHGLNPVKQKQWNDDVAHRLDDLKEFSQTYVNVTHQ